MKTIISMLMVGAFASVTIVPVLAQKKGEKDPKDDPKYTYYYTDVNDAVETNQVVLEFRNGVSRVDMCKFKTMFTNNTSDFLLINPSKFTVSTDGIEHQPKEKEFILNPNGKKSKTIDVKGGEGLRAESIEVRLAGFARISTDGAPVEMAEFQLPARANNIESGNFSVNLKQLKQETKETWARFEVKYTGEDYAIVDPSRISVKIEGGQQYANDNSKSKTILLEKGDKKNISAIFHIPAKVVDMQFATLMVQFGNAFSETKAEPFEVDESVTFEVDEALTQDKNK
jgi:archaellum component FlaG (FlaF/FlaG flagellin family)